MSNNKSKVINNGSAKKEVQKSVEKVKITKNKV